jgi:CBS domain containing-hemolysin-like protein
VVQIGLNAVAILGGIVGEGTLEPLASPCSLNNWLSARSRGRTAGFLTLIPDHTSLFILIFADLFPKRLGMTAPEHAAVWVVGPMQFLMTALEAAGLGLQRAAPTCCSGCFDHAHAARGNASLPRTSWP